MSQRERAAVAAYLEAIEIRDPVALKHAIGELQIVRIQARREAKR